ncbi:META domain-containing protein [Costertonia aggregata]|uniref:META domain-containing protein n=1 Tax=Costertonia aggregata TaxID=343403 RepID=A0A7H9AP50_9FLAO|nr:META domain-containing protein [Costertonia aggregata]QLG45163.1 META domain-containing protein [Costertonia aggregata]
MGKYIGLPLFFVILMGCDTGTVPDFFNQSRILGEWHVVEINGTGAPENQIIRITFDKNGGFGGSTPTNSYGGNYSVEDGSLSVSGVFSTLAVEGPYGASFFGFILNIEGTSQVSPKLKIDFESNGKLYLAHPDSKIMVLERP